MFYIPGAWSGPSLSNFGDPGILHRQGPSSGPLFIHTHGQPLTRSRLSSFIQSVLQGAGIPGHFSGHSFRIGAAITAAQCGIPYDYIYGDCHRCLTVTSFSDVAIGGSIDPGLKQDRQMYFDSA